MRYMATVKLKGIDKPVISEVFARNSHDAVAEATWEYNPRDIEWPVRVESSLMRDELSCAEATGDYNDEGDG